MKLKKLKKSIKRSNMHKKRKAEEDLDGHVVKKQRTVMGPLPKPDNWVEPDDGENDVNNSEENGDEENGEENGVDHYNDDEEDLNNDDYNNFDNYDEVPMEEYDSDEQAELLAMGEISLKPNGKQFLIEKSISKHAHPDDPKILPRWFKDDEDKHNKPNIPITKDQVLEWKRQLKSINARNPKKVIEAKARKKKHLQDQLQKAREKAKTIAVNSELGDREKIKQIQKLYKGGLSARARPNKVYVVARNFTGKSLPKGNLRIKLVDPRLKKDKRGKAAAENRKNKKR